jgi:glycosyltransferase involved in cell wall biosynthesis
LPLSRLRTLIANNDLMKIAYISTYPPCECGLATFNYNLIRAVDSNFSTSNNAKAGFVVALNNSESLEEYDYPAEVKFVIREKFQDDYQRAATFINASDADACILQHEFGIYGGESGVFVLPFLNLLKKPVIAILHTVLKSPTFLQKTIIKEISEQCVQLVVMSKLAVTFLTDIYQIPRGKISVIEHGVPDIDAPVVNPVKALPVLKHRRVLLTFGLISRNKGLETVIRALPQIVKLHPEVVYVVLGSTHPHILKSSGEEYREFLLNLAVELKVDQHLIFINKFLSEKELINYLTAADIYITPYFNEAQITSGTLSYAVGAGAAVVSTPYWHAQELLSNERGCLFDFKDETALAVIVNQLFDSPDRLNALKRNAYRYGLQTRWPQIGSLYMAMIKRSIASASSKILRRKGAAATMPVFNLAYVNRLTDDTGIFQHAKYDIPNRKEGYCLDDNARALIMALMAYQMNNSNESLGLLPVYLSYIQDMQLEDGNFRNFLSFGREFLDDEGSDDSFGRAIWALGYLIHTSPNISYAEFGHELFQKAVPHFKKLTHLRGICNTITGVSYYLRAHPYDERMMAQLVSLTNQVTAAYKETKDQDWHWFENKLTYDNAIFPLALFHSAEITRNDEVKQIALEALTFVENLTMSNNYLNPVGNDGWYSRDGQMPFYDQQAIELMGMVLMYFQAYQVTKDKECLDRMFASYNWFLGANSLRVPLYNAETGGCYDGLQPAGINRNQGAESTLAYLISHLTVLQAFKLGYKPNQQVEEMVSILQ